MEDLASLGHQSFCYVKTTGRRTGRPHEIEIWFGWAAGSTIYLLAGGGNRADWVRNLRARPATEVRIGDTTFRAEARGMHHPGEDALARRLLAAKYQGWQEGQDMSEWAKSALPIALDLTRAEDQASTR